MSKECDRYYLSYLDKQYPLWKKDPSQAIFDFTRRSDLIGIRSVLCACRCKETIPWQEVAEMAATKGNLDIIQYITRFYTLNWIPIAKLAQQNGFAAIAAYASGTDMPEELPPDEVHFDKVRKERVPEMVETRFDDEISSSQAYLNETNFVLGSRPTNAFRNSRFTPYNLDVDVGQGDEKITPTDEDFLPVEAMPFDDDNPYLGPVGHGFKGYYIVNPASGEDDIEESILPLVYGSRVYL